MIHAMRSRMLTRSDYDRILRAERLPDTLAALSDTGYGDVVRETDSDDLAGIEATLRGNLVHDIRSLAAMAPYEAKQLLRAISLSEEMQFLKAALRLSLTGGTAEEFAFPKGLGTPTDILVDAARSGNPIRVAELIPEESIRRELLSATSARDPTALFVAESTIDRSIYNRLWQACMALGPLDRQQAKRIITFLVDMFNTVTALRVRLLELPSDLEERLRIKGSAMNDVILDKMSSSRAYQEAMRVAASGPYASVIQRAGSATRQEPLSAIEHEFRRELRSTCEAALMGTPFNAGLIVAFLLLRRFEISDVLAILTGRKNEIPTERTRGILILAS
jgi:vacuolar-type H+-ATPase subunit C/Vma6